MPPRSETFPGGIVRLSKLLSHLNAPPKLVLPAARRLRLSLASKGDHFGAQHFVKNELPRIRYANPNLDIEVQMVPKTPQERWRPEIEVELVDGKVKKLDMNEKWSTSITKELMNLTGGEEWQRHVFSCKNAGLPILPGEDVHEIEERKMKAQPAKSGEKLPTLAEYLKAHPEKAKKDVENQQKASQRKEKKKSAKSDTSPSAHSGASASPSSATS